MFVRENAPEEPSEDVLLPGPSEDYPAWIRKLNMSRIAGIISTIPSATS